MNQFLLKGALAVVLLACLAPATVRLEASETSSGKFKPVNLLSFFSGYAAKDTEKRQDVWKVGVEYEYQFLEWLGARGFVDYEGGDLKKWLYGAGASVHVPKTHVIVFVGYGAENKDGHKEEDFFRLSAEYKFKVTEKGFIAPVIGYDFGRKDKGAFFLGLMVGTKF